MYTSESTGAYDCLDHGDATNLLCGTRSESPSAERGSRHSVLYTLALRTRSFAPFPSSTNFLSRRSPHRRTPRRIPSPPQQVDSISEATGISPGERNAQVRNARLPRKRNTYDALELHVWRRGNESPAGERGHPIQSPALSSSTRSTHQHPPNAPTISCLFLRHLSHARPRAVVDWSRSHHLQSTQ